MATIDPKTKMFVSAKGDVSVETEKMRDILLDIIPSKGDKEIVVMCVGSPRLVGDSVGPMVGSLLKENGVKNVYGTMEMAIHGGNCIVRVDKILKKHKDAFVLAIDASAGNVKDIGKIRITRGSFRIGKGINNSWKSFPDVGDASIIPVTFSYHRYKRNRIKEIMDVDLKLIVRIANIISDAVSSVLLDEPYRENKSSNVILRR